MITNEQILKVLKSWDVEAALISSGQIYGRSTQDHFSVTFKCPNDKNIVMNFGTGWDDTASVRKIEFSLNQVTNDGFTRPIYRCMVPDDILLEVSYLMTTAAKDYLSKQISSIFTESNPVGLDALI